MIALIVLALCFTGLAYLAITYHLAALILLAIATFGWLHQSGRRREAEEDAESYRRGNEMLTAQIQEHASWN